MKPPHPCLSADKAKKGGVSSGSERKELVFLARGFFLASSPQKDWKGIRRGEINYRAASLLVGRQADAVF